MRRFFTILRRYNLVLFIFATSCFGQTREGRGEEPRQNLPVSYEALPFYSVDTNAALVNVHYRINERFFIFVRDPDDREGFVAKGELMVELRNSQGIAAARDIRQIRLPRKTQPQEKEQLPDVEGAFSFQVPDGEYTVIFSLDDKESGRTFLDRDKKVTTRKAKLEPLELSFPMFTRFQAGTKVQNDIRIIPMNRGTDVTFGVSGGFVYQLYLPDNRPIQVHWKIQRQRGPLFEWFQSFSGEQYTLMNGTLQLENPKGEVSYSTHPTVNTAWKLLYIPLPLEKLDPGGYTIDTEISSEQVKSTKQHSFQILWLNRPATLLNVQISIDALRHIATEDDLSAMQTSSLERNIKAFYAFWKKKDPDTTTAYNEMLVEYYRRVDEANQRFSTLSGQDGYKTDRGRIYILYGSPTHTEKLVPPGEAPTEIWFYERLKRKFIFSDKQKTGNYLLISAENL